MSRPLRLRQGRDRLAVAINGLDQILFNLPSGNWAKGERGIACHPDRVTEFRDGVAPAIDDAHALECATVNFLAGIRPANATASEARRFGAARAARS
jgi:hydroxypyruvate isomerase